MKSDVIKSKYFIHFISVRCILSEAHSASWTFAPRKSRWPL